MGNQLTYTLTLTREEVLQLIDLVGSTPAHTEWDDIFLKLVKLRDQTRDPLGRIHET